MELIKLPKAALREKVLGCIDEYLALSGQQKISIGLYVAGRQYVIDLNDDEQSLYYDIGSVSKTLTAHLVLKLANAGLLDLHQPVSRYLPLKEGKYPTVYECMTHTAGYGHLMPLEITLPSLIRHGYARRNPYENTTKEAVLKALCRRNRYNGPKPYSYSDFPYAILALVAERVANEDFEVLMEGLLQDLMLENTHIFRQKKSPCAVRRGKTIPYWKWLPGNPYIAAGGMVSTLSDMLLYVARQIESDEDYILQTQQVCDASFQPGKNVGTCTGWHTYKRSDQLWHVGGVSTFRASLIANRRRRLGVVVLGNSKGINSANVHYIAKMLYSELKLKKVKHLV